LPREMSSRSMRRGAAWRLSAEATLEYVYLDAWFANGAPKLVIRLRERASQLVRFGFRGDNERGTQGMIDIRDENFHGSGMELGFTLLGGGRNQDAVLEYRARRLFETTLSFHVALFYGAKDSYLFADAPRTRENHWDRTRIGEYRTVRSGGKIAFGNQLERLGSVAVEYSLQDVRVKDRANASSMEEQYRLALLRFGTVVDSKDTYPFPTQGIGLDVSYELSSEALGSEVSYNALRVMYEFYSTWRGSHTFHPKITLGLADQTMPVAQQFRLGGRESFFGLQEDDAWAPTAPAGETSSIDTAFRSILCSTPMHGDVLMW